MKTGIELISEERQEQIEKHARSIRSDKKQNDNYQLSVAASLLCFPEKDNLGIYPDPPLDWNLDVWNKMCNKEYRERLIIAGALIAAELDRINL